MNAVIHRDCVKTFCVTQIIKSGIYANSFFRDIQNGAMTLEEFSLTQEQFYYAVSFFSRPMTALMARFPQAGKRLSILENIVEEHGSFNETAFHESTFREFLQLISVDISTIDQVVLWPEVRAFNSALMTACVFDEPEVGVACLGAIEYMFANISGTIGTSIVENKWCTKEELKHYKLHAEIDIQHAADFFMLVEPQWDNPEKNYYIKQGIDMGIYIFDRLYKDLRASAVKNCYNTKK